MHGIPERRFRELVDKTLEDETKRDALEKAFEAVPPDMVLFAEAQGVNFAEDDVLLGVVIENYEREHRCTNDEAFCAVTGATPMVDVTR